MESRIDTTYTAAADYNTKKSASANGGERTENSFSDLMTEKSAFSPKDMSLSEYKIYFYDKMNSMYTHPSQKRVFTFIDITDAAYKRMQADPAYEKKVLDFLANAKTVNYGSRPPQFVLIHIDDTWEKSYGYSYGVQDDERARRAAARRRLEAERAKKERRKKLLKAYLKKKAEEKRLQDKLLADRLAKHRFEHLQLIREWDDKRQKRQASKAYAASLVMMSRNPGLYPEIFP